MTTVFAYPRPWSWTNCDGRIYLLAANGNVVTELLPGQVRGKEPPLIVKKALAEAIVSGISGEPPAGPEEAKVA